MMQRLLCWFGFHDLQHSETWSPSFGARIVTRWTAISLCVRCRKVVDHVDFHFDPVTGAPIKPPAGEST